MSKMKNIILILLLACVTFLVACGSTDEGAEGSDIDGTEEETKESADATSQSDEVWDRIQEEGKMIVATSGTLIAASFYDDEENLTGYDVEVMKEVGSRLGVDVEFEIMGVDSMLPAVQSGRVDMAANDMGITEKRKEQFDFSEPYKYSYTTMAVRKADNSGIESLEDLEGKKAGGGATTIYSQIAEHYGAEVVTYGNAPNEAYLSDVNNGRTDLVMNDYYLTKFGVGAFPEFDIHLHPTLKFYPTEQGVILPKGASMLKEEIDQALAEMREDGTLSELAIQFYEEDASQKPEGEIQEIDAEIEL